MREFLKALKRDFNIPIVMATHDLTEAVDIADSIVVYIQGQGEQIRSSDEIFKSQRQRLLADLSVRDCTHSVTE